MFYNNFTIKNVNSKPDENQLRKAIGSKAKCYDSQLPFRDTFYIGNFFMITFTTEAKQL